MLEMVLPVFVLLLSLTNGANCLEKTSFGQRLRYFDCGNNGSIVTFEHFDALPSPLEMPGKLRLILKANFSSPPPEMTEVKIVLRKRMPNAGWVRIPCFFGIGSCDYHHLPTCLFTQELFGCPIRQQLYNINDSFFLTKPEQFLSSKIIEGHYQALVRVYHSDTHQQLACLAVQFSLISPE